MRILKLCTVLLLVSQFETALAAEMCQDVFSLAYAESPVGKPLQTKLFIKVESLLRKAGLGNFHEFQDKVHAQSAYYPKTYKIVTDEKVQFAIHAPEDYRTKIASEGFRQSYDTGNSYMKNPEYNDKYVNDRNAIERDAAQMGKREYDRIAPNEKPKYGLLRPPMESSLMPDLAFDYGKDVWILKKDLVKNRTTWTLGDSLNLTPMLKAMIKVLSKGHYRIRPNNWYASIFIPWSMRELMIPATEATANGYGTFGTSPIYKDAQERNTDMAYAAEKFKPGFLKVPLQEDMHMDNYKPLHSGNVSEYVEIQVWGTLDNPKYIDALIFYETPPTPELYNYLTRQGVKVYDGRNSREMNDYLDKQEASYDRPPLPRHNENPHPVLYQPGN